VVLLVSVFVFAFVLLRAGTLVLVFVRHLGRICGGIVASE
jgi:hypothetical protein